GAPPFEPGLREDRHPVALPDAELHETGADRLHALRALPVSDRSPRAVGLVPKRSGMIGVALHAGEEQLGESPGAHEVNRTVNLTGEPGNRALTPRLALAVTSTLAGAGPAMRRSRTAAMPRTSVVTVSVVTSVCAVSATATARNRTTNVAGEPGTGAWFARCARATTTTLSGMVSGASSRTFTNATPELFELAVSVVATACAVSCRTSVTGPATAGWTIV